ncbi:hypothetical protein [Arthrobacter sp. 31Y]|nr:hypothetical protein [Arthrobacter sp. 31Y]
MRANLKNVKTALHTEAYVEDIYDRIINFDAQERLKAAKRAENK